eukprot:CAMPEP_0185797472 /NCGR_PEP_ID=MMETSP1174-20130828/161634_1 /TAXON_ID=35687 /ORGANISM="Dictyocha speculum, Strain CCMP1381" /LENGTH=182 /DNA_ID=CAMNT_0028492907 /DNA_START=625 /DNA_END=1173 /DNA_ORIENTATION=-
MKYVHHDCLQEWLNRSYGEALMTDAKLRENCKCELCGHAYLLDENGQLATFTKAASRKRKDKKKNKKSSNSGNAAGIFQQLQDDDSGEEYHSSDGVEAHDKYASRTVSRTVSQKAEELMNLLELLNSRGLGHLWPLMEEEQIDLDAFMYFEDQSDFVDIGVDQRDMPSVMSLLTRVRQIHSV